jgi:hypothetical protein
VPHGNASTICCASYSAVGCRVLVTGLLFDFEPQPPPGSCHIDQDGLHSQIRGAFSHPLAFNGMLSALDRRNHRRTHNAPLAD